MRASNADSNRVSGRLTVQEQKLEGEFRYVNSRLITNSEEVKKKVAILL